MLDKSTMATLTLAARQASSSATKTGSHRNEGPNSVSGMLSTLIPCLVVALILLGIFLLARVKLERIYQPRTYLGVFTKEQKTPTPSQSKFAWFKDYWNLSNEYALHHHSLDAYLYLRFWRLIIIISFFGCLITWPILFPVYATAGNASKQFDRISYSNASDSPNRFYATAIVAWIFLGMVMYFIGRESVFYVHLRQRYLLSPMISNRMSAKTVIFTNVPEQFLNEQRLKSIFPLARYIWTATDTQDLDDLVAERDKIATKLEGAEVKLSKQAFKRQQKEQSGKDVEKGENIVSWVDSNKRPQHRLKPLIGEKVDTIDWCRKELKQIVPEVHEAQKRHWNGDATKVSAVIVEFQDVHSAEQARYGLTADMPSALVPRTIGTRPDEIIWKNLGMSKGSRTVRHICAFIVVIILILIWSPLSAFVGAVSNINALTNEVPFLSFILDVPSPILGIITGLIPTVLLALLMIIVPIILRFISKLAGAITLAEVELDTQKWYFWFQVIIVFLITTFSSGTASVATQIVQQPSMAITLLGRNLPKASNFYINYFVLYGVAVAAKTLFNVVAFLTYILLGKFLDSTPRKRYQRYVSVPALKWGSVYPKWINLAVIAISYATIAPLVLGFATVGLGLLYLAFRYNVLYSVDALQINQQGAGFALALQQLFTGIYLAEFCLIGLFAINTSGDAAGSGPLVLIVIFTLASIVYHILLSKTIDALRRSMGQESRLRQDEQGRHDKEQALASDKTTDTPRLTDREGKSAKVLSALLRVLHPGPIPNIGGPLEDGEQEYSSETRREAYLNPSVTSPVPLLWLVHDETGVAEREKEACAEIVGVSDVGAWWSQKDGSLTMVWDGQEDADGKNWVRDAPIYDEPIMY